MRMGNALVCLPQTLLPSPISHNTTSSCLRRRPARLVNAVTAQVQQVYDAERVNVAEVMLENPGTFVMPLFTAPTTPHDQLFNPAADHHNSFSFFEALPADHQLEHAHTYLLLPMHKLHKRASPQELAFLAHLAYNNTTTLSKAGAAAATAAGHINRVSPCDQSLFAYTSSAAAASPSSSCFFPPEQLLNSTSAGVHPLVHRSKSWKPNLQTIRESPNNHAGYGKQLTRLLSKGHLISTY